MSGDQRRGRFFRLPASESTVAREIDDEIAFHIEARVEELVAEGLPAEEARRRSELEFGDVASARAELASIDRVMMRRERRAAWWEAVWYDLRLAVRGMRRSVAFTATVVLTLALGIGVNAAMFGITDRLLLSPPPHVAEADDVVRVLYTRTPPSSGPTTSDMMAYADHSVLSGVSAFSSVAAYTGAATTIMGRRESAVELKLMRVTASYFPALGVRPVRGRFFTPEEDAGPRGERVLVIGYDLWQDRFGGADVLGTSVDIDNESYSIIGVAPSGFNGIDLSPVDAWAPISTVGADIVGDEWRTSRAASWLRIIARLRDGIGRNVAEQQASAAFVAANERLADDTTAAVLLGSVISARAPAVGTGAPQRTGRIALWLLGVSLLVLIMACVNVANLLLARGMRRRREVGVRVALGVTRLRLAGQVLSETVIIVLIGTVLGLLFAHWAGRAAGSMLLPDVDWGRTLLDRRMLAFAAAAALM
ncbi:MAG TPA: ABC transporter permease, partial [Longimicrobiales bacterium]|nr:ABC transporter permease [Longimicrobiales bacterium]